MTLSAIEFLRRFLLHVLPAGFVRIRHYGFLANRVCREKLALCRALLEVEPTSDPVPAPAITEPKETGDGPPATNVCPCCGEGRMVIVAAVRAIPVPCRRQSRPILEPAGLDSS